MNKFLLFILFIFSISLSAQNDAAKMQNVYLTELINSIQEESFNSIYSDDTNWRKNAVRNITSKNNILETSYIKTTMILHMLKYKLGEDTFFKGIEKYKTYLAENSIAVNIDDLQYYLENESGTELTYFFNDWFKSNGYPSYEITWYQNETTSDVNFSVKQIHRKVSNSFFEIPLPIELKGENGESQLIRLEVSKNGQTFTGNVPFNVISLEIDPDYNMISNNNIVKIGIDQEVLNTTIKLYPNPAKNSIQIQNSSDAVVEKVSIYNMLGKLILEETNPLLAINLKPLSTGVHLVKIQTSQGTLHKTILKK